MTVAAQADLATEQEQISFNNTSAKEANFETLCKGFYFYTTADVHIAFDRAVQSGDFLLTNSMGLVGMYDITATKVSAIGDAGSGTLYILARR